MFWRGSEEGAVISFTHDKQTGKFAIRAIETEIVLKVQVEEGDELNGLIGETLFKYAVTILEKCFLYGGIQC